MSLSLIIGKPGSGKSYFAVQKLVDWLVDRVGKDHRDGANAPSAVVCTNLTVNVDEISCYISSRIGVTVDCASYIHYLEDSFFCLAGQKLEWWENLPRGAFVILDEIHHYVGSETEKENKEYFVSWRNYISTHRHREQTLLFITQHPDNLSRSILSMASDAYHVVNIKNRVLPLIGIPMEDLDVVKEAFGFSHQYAQVIYGAYVGRAFKREHVYQLLLKPEIYRLYTSHTLTDATQASDKPSLHLSWLGAIWWLFRRHAWHLTLKIGLVWIVIHTVFVIITQLPSRATEAALKAVNGKKTENLENLENPVVLESTFSDTKNEGTVNQSTEIPSKIPDDVIYIIATDYIVTSRGRVSLGETLQYQGRKQRLVKTDVKNSTIVCDVVRVRDRLSVSRAEGADSSVGDLQGPAGAENCLGEKGNEN